MPLSSRISHVVQNIIDRSWSLRKGRSVPVTEDVALSGGSVELEATFFYADLADSSKMVKELDRRVAAKIMKSFLAATCSLIKARGGVIQSFDGDRVMGVFIGKTKNSDAAKCALQVKYVFQHHIRPKFEKKYDSLRNASFTLNYGVGIDTGTVIAVRSGVRGSNDLIWIGRPPNLAAKLSDLRESIYKSLITASVYNQLNGSVKFGGANNTNMWKRKTWPFLDENITVYCSSWEWEP